MILFPRFMRQKKKNIQTYLGKNWKKRFFLQVGFVLIMLGLIAFSLYQLVQHMTVGLDTLRTQEMLDETYTHLELYTFRDETVLTSNGQVHAYHVAHGERVGVGATLATAYTCPEGVDAAETQAQITALCHRMAALKHPIGQDHPAAIEDLSDAIDLAYLSFLQAVGQGDLEAAAAHAEIMEKYLRDYDTLLGGDSSVKESLTQLQNTQKALTDTLSLVGSVSTEQSGYFYYETDGYENVFTAQKALDMTPDDFLSLIEAMTPEETQNCVGKMAYTATWYAAAYVSFSDVTAFQESVGASFDMVRTDGTGLTIPMTLVRMEPHTNGALLVFETQAMPDGFDFSRSFSVVLKTGAQSGYRVPTDAIVTLSTKAGDLQGVYVLEGNVVEFRKVIVKMRYDGYVLTQTHASIQAMLEGMEETQREELTADGYEYLQLNDKIITRGTGLYDGKIIS